MKESKQLLLANKAWAAELTEPHRILTEAGIEVSVAASRTTEAELAEVGR